MITTKRQIRRDSDRFGGYYGGDNGSPLLNEYGFIGNIDPISEDTGAGSMIRSDADMDITVDTPTRQPAVERKLYTTLSDSAKTNPLSAPVPTLPEREKKQVITEKEDLLPTVKTRAYASGKKEETEDKDKEQSRARARRTGKTLDMRTKVMLVVYVAVALVLAIAVITTGVSISSAAAKADAVSRQISQKQAVIVEQERTLAVLRDEDAIRGKAMQNGMVQAGDPVYNVKPSEDVGYSPAEPKTDGFDKFLDWLAEILN